jgi:hypothetical protein
MQPDYLEPYPTNDEIMARANAVKAAAEPQLRAEYETPIPPSLLGPPPWEVDEWVQHDLDLIDYVFRKFTERDPGLIDPMLDDLGSVWLNLDANVVANTETVKLRLAEWQGEAARSFRDNYLAYFERANGHQLSLLEEIRKALLAYRTVLTQSRAKIMEIGSTAINAFNSIGSDNIALNLAIVAAIAPVVGVAISVETGIAWALSQALFDGMAAYADIHRESASGVLNTTIAATDTLEVHMIAVERTIATALQTDFATLNAYRTEFELPRPQIADDADAFTDFGTPIDLSQYQLPPELVHHG